MIENDAARAQRLQELFLAAVEIADPLERENFLRRQCADDSDFRREAQSRVAADCPEDSFLEQVPAELPPLKDSPAPETPLDGVEIATSAGEEKTSPESPSLLPRIPGYEIRGVLGRGGMGVVYQ